MNSTKNLLPEEEKEKLLDILQQRFQKYKERHPNIIWQEVAERLEAFPEKLWSLHQMESTGGEPDVLETVTKNGGFTFYDCAPETPSGRRSLCYDREAWEARKEAKPKSNVIDMATAMGIDLLTEDQYTFLQSKGSFDQKTSSWLRTPDEIRKKGGAIFGDFRFGRIFIYHNGAQSYYAARGFRGILKV